MSTRYKLGYASLSEQDKVKSLKQRKIYIETLTDSYLFMRERDHSPRASVNQVIDWVTADLKRIREQDERGDFAEFYK